MIEPEDMEKAKEKADEMLCAAIRSMGLHPEDAPDSAYYRMLEWVAENLAYGYAQARDTERKRLAGIR